MPPLDELQATVDAVRKPDTSTGKYKIVGYEWVLYATNGRPIAQQARRSSSERGAWRAFRVFCTAAQDISDEPWIDA